MCWSRYTLDFLTPERRSRLMSSVRHKGTDIELLVARELRLRGYRFRRNVRTLAGSPDLVFAQHKLAVFIDGDFWHGFRYPCFQMLAAYNRQAGASKQAPYLRSESDRSMRSRHVEDEFEDGGVRKVLNAHQRDPVLRPLHCRLNRGRNLQRRISQQCGR